MDIEKRPYKPFGNEITDQGKNKPKGKDKWTNDDNEYWSTLESAGENKKILDAIPHKSIQDAVSTAQNIENRLITEGDSLSKILVNEVGLSGKYLLRAVIDLEKQGVGVDTIHTGANLSVVKRGNNLFLTIANNKDNDQENVALFSGQKGVAVEETVGERSALKNALVAELQKLDVNIGDVSSVSKIHNRNNGTISIRLPTENNGFKRISLDEYLFSGEDPAIAINAILQVK